MSSAIIADRSFAIVDSRAIGWYALGSWFKGLPGFLSMQVMDSFYVR